MRKELTFALLALPFLAGCVQLETTVARFHTLPATPAPLTFQMAMEENQKESIESKTYAALIADRLAAYGWRRAESPVEAVDRLVSFSYGVDNGRKVTGSTPAFAQNRGGTLQSYGSVNTLVGAGNYSTAVYMQPTFGVVDHVPYTATLYDRFLVVNIVDAKAPGAVNVFEGKAKSTGTTEDIGDVLPVMIKAMFKHFPGKSGQTETIRLPMDIR